MKKPVFLFMLIFLFCSCTPKWILERYVMDTNNGASGKDTYIRTFMANAVKSDSIKPFFANSPIYFFHLKRLQPLNFEAIAFRADSAFMVSREIGFNEFIKGENCTIQTDSSALHLVKIFICLHWYHPEGVIRFYHQVEEANYLFDPPKIRKRHSWFEVRIDFSVKWGEGDTFLGRADYIVNKNGVIEGYYHSLVH